MRFWRRRLTDKDLDDEIQAHLAIEAQQRIETGEAPDDAARAARRAFGNVLLIQEQTRDVWTRRSLEALGQDIRYAIRAMRQAPAFTLTAMLTLALGIGANTAIFSVIEAVFLRPLPVANPNQLVFLSDDGLSGTLSTDTPRDGAWQEYSSASYEFLRDAALPFDGVAAFEGNGHETVAIRRLHTDRESGPTAARSPRDAIRASAHLVSGNFFDVMRVWPERGRTLDAADDRPGAPAAIVVSDRFWRTALEASPTVIGEPMLLNRLSVTVVGVMPPEFFGERVRGAPDVWAPLAWRADVQQRDPRHDNPNEDWLGLIGRLRPGVAARGVEVAATSALRQFLTAQAGTSLDDAARARIGRTRVDLSSAARGQSDTRKRDARPLALLLGAVVLVLLVACANVATLLLSRATARRAEVAVRRTLGASSGRLVRQWLTESAVLGIAGAAGGLLVARWAAPALEAQFPTGPVHATLNVPVLGFTLLVALVASLAFGLAPAMHAGRVDPIGGLRGSGRSTRGRRRTFGTTEPFVVAQIALSVVLVVGAALFVRTLLNLEHEPLGFDQDNVLLTPVNARTAGYTPADVLELYRRLYDRVAALPGVESATFARFSPFGGHTSAFGSSVEGYTPPAGTRLQLEAVEVGPNYPATLGMPLAEGRAIDLRDVLGAPLVAMVNEVFARRFFAGGSAVGHHLSLGGRNVTIVGVVKDALFHSARDTPVPFVFTAMLQEQSNMAMDCEIELRTTGDAHALVAAVRKAVADTDSRVGVSHAQTLREQVLATLGPERLAAGFVGIFAALALLLAAIGLYGVIAHSVAGRTNEIGIRLALGAAPTHILWLIVHETMVWLALGLGVGVAGAEASVHFVASQLFGVSGTDVLSIAVAGVTLAVVAIAASLVPAARALRVHPAVALRIE